ncbi:CheR family methyltransferase [Cyclobacterium salsum]|uniref:CheR family methyltransferase n=1 Tax=Cyclobacterium salsum TaxID=2666329 RepID=UPI0013918BEC|nr:CheR family methyltransferase [Cyclobacterium salsum]
MNINFPVIALGASAGGLEPLELFFENTNKKSKYAYVIIQHLAPNHKSLMDELLSRHTKLPIKKIEHGMPIERGNIYLNPPKKFVEIKAGKFFLSEKEDRTLSFPISDFFSSQAENMQEKACAIVLSGTGSDGSKGVKFVKEKGGLVLVQDPQQAKFNGMPNNAIYTGVVDKVCRVEMMHEEIDRFFENRDTISQNYGNSSKANSVITDILKSIEEQINVDFTGYKYTTVSRRISRRMSILDYTKMDAYFNYLQDNQNEAQLLAKELLIGVTRFFRDEDAFNALKTQVIPKLMEENSDSKSIRVWVPGCSSGEEAYSIALLIKDYLRANKLQYEVNIFATDLDKEAIKRAANRVFSKNISAEIPAEYLNTYFVTQKNGYAIAKEIREMIVFSVHNVIQDPPFNKIDLISCRNLLIYLTDSVQQQLFTIFQYSLKSNGVLFLGSSETLGTARDEFSELNKQSNIFLNKENKKFVQRLHSIKKRYPASSDHLPTNDADSKPPILQANKKGLLNEIQHSLIQEYVPDSLVVDEHFNLLHSSGNAHRLLTLPSGEISSNIFRMLPESLSVPLEVVANKVLQTGKLVTLADIKIPEELKAIFGSNLFLSIKVRKKELFDGMDYLFITFESSSIRLTEKSPSENVTINTVSQEKIHILERELRINRETLQTTIEELESSNEELQATNEELQSSNEELESVNEELYTVNAEYEQKNQELSQSNDDLNNLIRSTELAILFLDANLNIRKFTPAIKKILDLVPHDIGRNISQFRAKIQLDNFLEHIESVVAESVSYEFTIEDIKGKEYLLKIAPFKSHKKEVRGITLVFVDLTQANKLKKAIEVSEKALSDLELKHENQDEIFKLISNNLRDMVCIVSPDGTIEYCSPSGAKITGYSLEKLYHINLLDQIVDENHRNIFQKAFSSANKNQDPGLIEFEFKRPEDNSRWLEASIKPILQKKSEEQKFLLIIRDIHQRKLNEFEFTKNALIAEQTSSAVLITDISGAISFANDAFEKMSGYHEHEILGKKPGSFLQGSESDPELIQLMSRSLEERKPFNVDITNYGKSGYKYIVNIKAEPLKDKEGDLIGFFSIQNDITDQQDRINQIHKLNAIVKEQFRKLKEVNKSLEDFAYIASHDLKAPIRNIKGLLGIIRKKGDALGEEKRKKYFDVIVSSSNEMDQMINNLLEYSRTGVSNEKWELVKIPELFREVVQLFRSDLDKIKGKVIYDFAVAEAPVYPILFKRLVSNLISNAIKYRREQDLIIHLKNKRVANGILFEISDNGVGIPHEESETIFKMFKSLKPDKESNGIGLSVCKKIVELHEGTIWVASEEAKGSTFSFTIAENL